MLKLVFMIDNNQQGYKAMCSFRESQPIGPSQWRQSFSDWERD